MRKFNIIINHLSNDLYAIVLKSFTLDEEGKQTNIETLVKSGLTFQESLTLQNNFINGNNN